MNMRLHSCYLHSGAALLVRWQLNEVKHCQVSSRQTTSTAALKDRQLIKLLTRCLMEAWCAQLAVANSRWWPGAVASESVHTCLHTAGHSRSSSDCLCASAAVSTASWLDPDSCETAATAAAAVVADCAVEAPAAWPLLDSQLVWPAELPVLRQLMHLVFDRCAPWRHAAAELAGSSTCLGCVLFLALPHTGRWCPRRLWLRYIISTGAFEPTLLLFHCGEHAM